MILHQENSSVYKEIQSLIELSKKFSTDFRDYDKHALKKNGYLPLDIALNSDLLAVWKILGVGGAMKNAELACHCCAVAKDDLLRIQNRSECKWCQGLHQDKGDNWNCYHQPMLTETKVDELWVQVENLQATLEGIMPHGIDVLMASTEKDMKEDPQLPTGNSQNDPRSIHVIYNATGISEDDQDNYGNTLARDLARRGLNFAGTIADHQKCLRNSLLKEWTLRHLLASIAHSDKEIEQFMLLLIEAVPCILYLENRVGLKILMVLLHEGLKYTKDDSLFPNIPSKSEQVDQFFNMVNRYCNESIWGTVDCPAQWKCPREGTKMDQVCEISLENTRTRLCILHLGGLIKQAIVDPQQKTMWIGCINDRFIPAMSLLRQKTDFKNDNIDSFQGKIDCFFQIGLYFMAELE
ncbi:hypothetical protein ACA910_010058 [Epithemia clementina (nom. ined.)]